ncbi:acyl-CoA carboxylase subunit epsilon [Streptomyces diastatochromogenes]|uniref:acyl-CoA carboxylase subunit epsilon n=1 Tax=Streptomyces diastatochromogenes TaxID=42236 RepID=UPI0036AEB0A8
MSVPPEERSMASLVRIERGRLDPEELAAVTVLLLARIGAVAAAGSGPAQRPAAAGWRRPERRQSYRSVLSWRS